MILKRLKKYTWLLPLGLTACFSKGQTSDVTPTPEPTPETVELGAPLPGLTAEELAAFERGKVLFTKRFKPSEGLGPFYNATACSSCHSTPVVGGGSELYRNFYVAVVDPGFGPVFQSPLLGLPSPIIPAYGTTSSPTHTLEGGRLRMVSTSFPIVTAQRNSIPIFGTGLFEFISNATILANADPDDDNNDGISGRTNSDGAGMGRFGQKAQSNSIEFFTRAPLMNQMGITSNPFLGTGGTISLAPGMAPQGTGTPNAPTTDNDGVSDPEISPDDLGDLIAFSRFLARQAMPSSSARRPWTCGRISTRIHAKRSVNSGGVSEHASGTLISAISTSVSAPSVEERFPPRAPPPSLTKRTLPLQAHLKSRGRSNLFS